MSNLEDAKARLVAAKADTERHEMYEGRSHNCVYRREMEAASLVAFYEKQELLEIEQANAKHRAEVVAE